jgi:hypothetical protein
MKRWIYLLSIGMFILVAFSGGRLHAQAWARTYGGAGGDLPHEVKQTSTGDFIAVGSTGSFGGGAWVLKLNPSGAVLWQLVFGGFPLRESFSVTEAANGEFIVAGRRLTGSSDQDLWVARLTAAGALVWQKYYGGSGFEGASSVQETASLDIVVAGMTNSYGAGDADFWVLMLDSLGNSQWQRTYGGAGADQATSIQETFTGGTSDGFVVIGLTHSFGAGNADIWVLKLGSAGSIQWQQTYGGTGDDSTGAFGMMGSIQQTASGGYILAGSTESFGAGGIDAWLLELNSVGVIQWQKTYGGNLRDIAAEARQTPNGDFVVAGLSSDGNFWGMRLAAGGNILWEKIYSVSTIPLFGARGVDLTSDGGFVFAGGTMSCGFACIDFYVVKVDKNGEINPVCPFGNSSVSTVTPNVITNSTFVLAATTNDPGAGPSPGPTSTTASPNTVCSSPMIAQSSSYCISGVSTGANYSWFIDLNSNATIQPLEPVENNVVNTVPAGSNGEDLAAAFVQSINANAKSIATATKAALTTPTPDNCFTLKNFGVCDTNIGVCTTGSTVIGFSCTTNADCSPTPDLYVGPVNNPTNCHVTSAGCAYNPIIKQQDVDGDGFSPPWDCDDLDAGIFPGATEACNGLDDDCDGDVDQGGICCSPVPLGQGYYHRQCLGAGLITPGRHGRGPEMVLEPDFVKTLVPTVDARLQGTIFVPPTYRTCEDGIDAVPPSDKCEKALKQYTAFLLNIESGRLADSCSIDMSSFGCTSGTTANLAVEMAGLINTGNEDSCNLAASCAAAMNENEFAIPVQSTGAPRGTADAATGLVGAVAETGESTTPSAYDVQTTGTETRAPKDAVEEPIPLEEMESPPALISVPAGSTTAAPESDQETKRLSIMGTKEAHMEIRSHLAVLSGDSASEEQLSTSKAALLTALGGGYEPNLRLQIVQEILSKVDVAYYSLLAKHLESIRDEAMETGNETIVKEASRLLKSVDRFRVSTK